MYQEKIHFSFSTLICQCYRCKIRCMLNSHVIVIEFFPNYLFIYLVNHSFIYLSIYEPRCEKNFNRSDTNRSEKLQKMARGLKFRVLERRMLFFGDGPVYVRYRSGLKTRTIGLITLGTA